MGIGSADEEYRRAGARIAQTAAEVFAQTELVVKVKEPQPVECAMLRRGQVLFTYLHLAADPTLTRDLMASGLRALLTRPSLGPAAVSLSYSDVRSSGSPCTAGGSGGPPEGGGWARDPARWRRGSRPGES